MPYKDPTKQKEAQHKHYLENKQQYIDRLKARQDVLKKWIVNYKKQCTCIVCDCKEAECLEFHHIDPNNKTDNISALIGKTCSENRVLKELENCEALCANCHRKRHVQY